MRLRRAAAAANNNQQPLHCCGVGGMMWLIAALSLTLAASGHFTDSQRE